MELYDFVKLIRRKKKTIFTIVFTVLILVLAVNFVLPKKYGSTIETLIIQNNLNNSDPYLVSKSSEHLGNVLGQVVFSGSFYSKVMNSGFGVNGSYFGKTNKDKLKKWSETVSVKSIQDTGILQITAVHPDREQAELIVSAIGYDLKTYHSEYHGDGDQVEVKTINEPVTSNFPVKPNMIINVVAGLVFSLMFGFLYVYLFPDKKYDLALLPTREKRKLKKIESILVEEKPTKKKVFKKPVEKKEDSGDYFDKNEIYQETEDTQDDDDFGGYENEEGDDSDDLDIDYEEIERKGDIKNIL